jgi:hypothetical protein
MKKSRASINLAVSRSASRRSGITEAPANRPRTKFAAVRVSFTWLGVRKTLSAEQKSQAAESFGAEGQYLSAAKKLLDTKHPAFSAVTSLRSQIVSYWKGLSLPYPEPGMRLIKQDQIEPFNQQLVEYRRLLNEAVVNLDQHLETLKQKAREQLGSLYNPADYPTSLLGLFEVEWDFPSVEPPEYLLRLNPARVGQSRRNGRNRHAWRADKPGHGVHDPNPFLRTSVSAPRHPSH